MTLNMTKACSSWCFGFFLSWNSCCPYQICNRYFIFSGNYSLKKTPNLIIVQLVFQTTAWLTETPSISAELGQHLSEPSALKTLLLHYRQMENLSSGQISAIMPHILGLVALAHMFFPTLQLLLAVRIINFGLLWLSLV